MGWHCTPAGLFLCSPSPTLHTTPQAVVHTTDYHPSTSGDATWVEAPGKKEGLFLPRTQPVNCKQHGEWLLDSGEKRTVILPSICCLLRWAFYVKAGEGGCTHTRDHSAWLCLFMCHIPTPCHPSRVGWEGAEHTHPRMPFSPQGGTYLQIPHPGIYMPEATTHVQQIRNNICALS